jgi:hypothetical protein
MSIAQTLENFMHETDAPNLRTVPISVPRPPPLPSIQSDKSIVTHQSDHIENKVQLCKFRSHVKSVNVTRHNIQRFMTRTVDLLTPRGRIILEKLAAEDISQHLYGTWRFITVFTRARRWSLFWMRWIQSSSTSHPISLKSILILSFHLCLGLTNGPFLIWFSNQNFPSYSANVSILYISPVQRGARDILSWRPNLLCWL